MELTLIVAKNCNTCKIVEAQLKKFIVDKINLNLLVTDINNFNRPGIAVVPALLIEDELFCYGDVNETKLISKVTELQHRGD